ncbi:hypothetical protein CENSYa_0169 [Cenarchaeum symbiosum A]|uniref:Uncharacterized protein n=1 Tax=Cenarchaeum symbiosum (strain A) TaxID=414004 RepID=A0RTZ7_CENSY|nr:hypothetical protein CENSYa_0169 [Cenarchaeum symbiosum A]
MGPCRSILDGYYTSGRRCGRLAAKKTYEDFEIVKEPWTVYLLDDGTKLKTRTTMNTMWYVIKGGTQSHTYESQETNIVLCHPSMQGRKDTTVRAKEQLEKNTEIEDCRYEVISEEPTEYLMEDGTKVFIYRKLCKISRTRYNDRHGNRIYLYSIDESSKFDSPPLGTCPTCGHDHSHDHSHDPQ